MVSLYQKNLVNVDLRTVRVGEDFENVGVMNVNMVRQQK